MSMQKKPLNQKRLTNVAVVRLRSHGIKFEIACYNTLLYKNKVVNWRDGLETDISEVLQTTSIFANVSQGELAKEKDLKKAFGELDELAICKRILDKGDFQLSEKERQVALSALQKDVLHIVSRRCINPDSRRPLTLIQAESAMKESGYVLRPNVGAKKQALKAINEIVKKLPHLVAKANMRMGLRCPTTTALEIRRRIEETAGLSLKIESETQDDNGTTDFIFQCDPAFYRDLEKLGDLRVLDTLIVQEGERNLEDAMRLDDDFDFLENDSDDGELGASAVTPRGEHFIVPGGGAGGQQGRSILGGVGGGTGPTVSSSSSAQILTTPGSGGAVPATPDGSWVVVSEESPAASTSIGGHPIGQLRERNGGANSVVSGTSARLINSPAVVGIGGGTASGSVSGGPAGAGGFSAGAAAMSSSAHPGTGLDPDGGGAGTVASSSAAGGGAPAGSAGSSIPDDPSKVCTTCGFFGEENIRAHMKSERHQENVKRKCDGKSVFSPQEYEEYKFDLEYMAQQQGGKKERRKKKG